MLVCFYLSHYCYPGWHCPPEWRKKCSKCAVSATVILLLLALFLAPFQSFGAPSGGLEPEQFSVGSNVLRSSYRKADQPLQSIKPHNDSPKSSQSEAPPISSSPQQQVEVARSSKVPAVSNLPHPKSFFPIIQSSSQSRLPNQHPVSFPPSVYYGVASSSQPFSPYQRKPGIYETMKRHLVVFEPWNRTEPCSAVVSELRINPFQFKRAMLLDIVLAAISKSSHETPNQQDVSSKDAVAALHNLYHIILEKNAESHYEEGTVGLLPYIGRLIECEADPITGRTIYQKLIQLGMTDAAESHFAKWLSDGSETFRPHLRLDKVCLSDLEPGEGNTLVHLAVSSGSISTLHALEHKEARRYLSSEVLSSQMFSYWLISALNHANNDGKRPIDLSPTPGLKTYLKRLFRTHINHVKREVNPEGSSSASSLGPVSQSINLSAAAA